MNLSLFEPDWGVDNSPLDQTEITTTILYFSKEELKEFKSLCKTAMKLEYPLVFQKEGNLSDLLLKILQEKYGKTNP
jgi:hypothetical protein